MPYRHETIRKCDQNRQRLRSPCGAVARPVSRQQTFTRWLETRAKFAQLRSVLKRYPKSGESSSAHNRLEAYGVALVGGEAEAEECIRPVSLIRPIRIISLYE